MLFRSGRMPVFVAPDAFDMWLDCAHVEAEVAAALIRPADEALLEAYPVSSAVNRAANDAEALVTPAPLEPVAEPMSAEPMSAAPVAKPARAKLKKTTKPDGQASLF